MDQTELLTMLKDVVELYKAGALTHLEFQDTKRFLLSKLERPPLGGPIGEGAHASGQTLVHASGSVPETPAQAGTSHPLASLARSASTPLSSNSSVSPPFAGLEQGERWQRQRLLGQGIRGASWQCLDLHTQRPCVVTWMMPMRASLEEERRQVEAQHQWLSTLRRPGFPQVEAVELDAACGQIRVAREYVEGLSLGVMCAQVPRQIRERSFFWPMVLSFVSQTSDLLDFARQRGFVHGRLQPSNVILTADGTFALTDGGAAIGQLWRDSRVVVPGGMPLVTQAPEMLRLEGTVSPAADVYALGAMLYYLLTQEWPVGAVEPPSHREAELPPDLDAVVMQALDPRPEQRWETTALFQAALHNVWSAMPGFAPGSSRQKVFEQWLEKVWDIFAPPSQQSAVAGAVEGSARRPATTSLLPSSRLVPSRSAYLHERQQRARRATPRTGSLSLGHGEKRAWTNEELLSLEPSPPLATRLSGRTGADLSHGATPSPPSERPVPSVPSDDNRELSLVLEEYTDTMELSLRQEATATPGTSFDALHLPGLEQEQKVQTLTARDGTPLLQMVCVPAGAFRMGAPLDAPEVEEYEVLDRMVEVEPYWISRTPITNRVWLKFIEESGYHNPSYSYLRHWRGGRPRLEQLDHPVVFLSFEDLEHFCLFYQAAIPSEEQWEKAARGLHGQTWPWGDDPPSRELCNFLGANVHGTTQVASYPDASSPFGLYDCAGNVWEWCRASSLYRKAPPATLSAGPSDELYVLRGGCFRDTAKHLRCFTRCQPMLPADYIGARVVLAEEDRG